MLFTEELEAKELEAVDAEELIFKRLKITNLIILKYFSKQKVFQFFLKNT